MVITKLIGGLGNQMFQYAAGRSLAMANNCPLKLDIFSFDNYKLHNGYELSLFDIEASVAAEDEISKLVSRSPLVLHLFKLLKLQKPGHYSEKSFAFDESFFEIKDSVYLEGYWQSEKYFQDISDVIRSDFTFMPSLNLPNAKLAEQIGKVNAVSLHVRRGDYVKNPKTNATHGLCKLEYYQSAIQHIVVRVEQPSFFIFSDDTSWVKENLKIDLPCQYVDHNQGPESYNDMRLMSLCKHHIIANSSFSWWGAWLNPDPKKIVIAPKRWFATSIDTSNLLPDSWRTI